MEFLLKLFGLCLVYLAGPCAAGKNWALLIAGSRNWFNYGSQASVCHAYQSLKKSGMATERIIVMMYDDIAYNQVNPRPGTIINRYDGPDVYHGVSKDYTRHEITAEVFLAVLRGDKAAVKELIGREGKVIESGPDDNIFVYYTDHGGARLVRMPNGGVLYARALNSTLTEMYKNKKYKNLLFYLEACNSGSMFKDILSPHIGVYATTASKASEIAYLIFCRSKYYTCLSGEYSCNWQRDNDAFNPQIETVGTQFDNTKQNTIRSHVQEFGDLSIKPKTLGNFFGENGQMHEVNKVPGCVNVKDKAVPATSAKIESIKAQLAELQDQSGEKRSRLRRQLRTELRLMNDTDALFLDIARLVFKGQVPNDQLAKWVFRQSYENVRDEDCYEDTVNSLLRVWCPELNPILNPYSLPRWASLIHACNAKDYLTVANAALTAARYSNLCRKPSMKKRSKKSFIDRYVSYKYKVLSGPWV